MLIKLKIGLKFDKHISAKINSANRVLGSIKHSIREAPAASKLLAYTSLCRPILEYADCLWDPADKSSSEAIEQVQKQAVRFVKNIRGRHGVADALSKLELSTLKDRRLNHRIALLLRILSNEEVNQSLSAAYEKIVKKPTGYNRCYQGCKQGSTQIGLCLISALLQQLLPKTIRDLRIGSYNTTSTTT